jgi:hypothetical protein
MRASDCRQCATSAVFKIPPRFTNRATRKAHQRGAGAVRQKRARLGGWPPHTTRGFFYSPTSARQLPPQPIPRGNHARGWFQTQSRMGGCTNALATHALLAHFSRKHAPCWTIGALHAIPYGELHHYLCLRRLPVPRAEQSGRLNRMGGEPASCSPPGKPSLTRKRSGGSRSSSVSALTTRSPLAARCHAPRDPEPMPRSGPRPHARRTTRPGRRTPSPSRTHSSCSSTPRHVPHCSPSCSFFPSFTTSWPPFAAAARRAIPPPAPVLHLSISCNCRQVYTLGSSSEMSDILFPLPTERLSQVGARTCTRRLAHRLLRAPLRRWTVRPASALRSDACAAADDIAPARRQVGDRVLVPPAGGEPGFQVHRLGPLSARSSSTTRHGPRCMCLQRQGE